MISVLSCIILFTVITYGRCDGQELLTPAERLWLDENKSRIVLAVETNYQPFVFLGPKDRITGLAHEYMLLLESKIGVHFKQRHFSSLNDIFEKVRTGDVHIVNAVTETPWRSNFLTFTDPYITVPNVIIMRKEHSGSIGEEDLSKMKVALVKDYAVTEHITKKGFVRVPDLVSDDLTALLNVSFGRSDAAIIDLASASYLISQKNITNLRVVGKASVDILLAIGTPKDEPVLHSILQKGYAAITASERKEILNRWINSSGNIIFTDWRFWGVLGGVLFFVSAVIACVLIWNRMLRQQVALRTDALQNKTEALQKSEASLRRAANAGKVGLWDWDLRTSQVFFSPEWKNQIGYKDHEIEGRYEEWEKRLHPDDLEKTIQLLKASQDPPWPPYEAEFRLRHKDDTYRWILATGNIEFDEQNNPIRMMGSHVDITERMRADEEKSSLETQLQQAQKMESVGRLAGGVAHDFNNMLSVIIGHAEIAQDQIAPSQPLYEDLEEIRKAAERSADLTRQLLAFARKQTVSPKVLDINDTVTHMLKMLRRLIGEHIELAWVPGLDVWPVKIDPSQIDQILANLCVNARDSITRVGKITIYTGNIIFDDEFCSNHPDFAPGEYIKLTVSDTGRGMSKETLSHIFEPFFTTKGVGEGTGLGLSAVYGAVRQNNGFIETQSEPGVGTDFTIYLPRHVSKPTAPQRSQTENP
ncbi:MAG: transporter substrate-binding domain-containing protein [Desulfobacteraceae bacterium]|jgi:PAS domain S-box-containing protein